MDETPPDFIEPGLPEFSWDQYAWVAQDTLPSWAGFQARGGAYGARDSRAPSRGWSSEVTADGGRDLDEP